MTADDLEVIYDSSGDNTSDLPLEIEGVSASTPVVLTIQQKTNPVSITAAGGATVTKGATPETVQVSGTVAAVNATLDTYVPPSGTDTISMAVTDGTVVATYGTVFKNYDTDEESELSVPAGLSATALTPVAFNTVTVPMVPYEYAALTVTLTAKSGLFFTTDLSNVGAATIAGVGTSTVTITATTAAGFDAALATLVYAGTGTTDTIGVTFDAGGTAINTIGIPVTLATTPPAASFTWATGSGTWQAAADWSGTGGARAPDGADQVTLGADGGTIEVTGLGAAGSLAVSGNYQLSAVVDVVGQLSVSGLLKLLGASGTDPVEIDTGSAVVGGSNTASAAELDVTSTDWINAGTLQIGSSTAGTAGEGTLEVRDGGTLTTGAVTVGAGGLFSIVSAASAVVNGTLTVGSAAGPVGGRNGVLVAAGNLTATALVLNAGASVLTKGTDALGQLVVGQGALFGGVSTVSAAGGAATTIVNNGTIDGPASLLPLTLVGAITGTGVLSVDGGGGLTLDGAVAATQTVVFKPGEGPLGTLPNGSAGGVLTLDTPTSFAAVIDGFAAGDAIAVQSLTDPITSASLLAGNVLTLLDASGKSVGKLKLDPTASYAGQSFSVTGVPNEDDYGDTIASTMFLIQVQATGQAAPVIATSGGARVQEGAVAVVPLVSLRVPNLAYDPAIFNEDDDQDTFYSFTFKASTGTMTELASLVGLDGLLDGSVPGPGDGTLTGMDDNGDTITELQVQGTGTQQLTVSGNNTTLVNLQAALVEYAAGNAAGQATVTVSGSAMINGVTTYATPVGVAFTVAATPVTYTWNTGGSQDGTAAANWTGSDGTAGPPGAGDTTIFGAGAYAVTGDISTGALFVTGDTFLTGAIYVDGDLVAQQNGAAAFGGALYVTSDVLIGASGEGSLNLSGLLNVIDGNVDIGFTGSGYFQTDALVFIGGALNVGFDADGAVDIGSNTANGVGGSLFGGSLTTGAGAIGVGAGVTGAVQVENADWTVTNALTVGLAGTGTLQLLAPGGYTTVTAASFVVGENAGSFGTVTLSGSSALTVNGVSTVGQAGAGSLVIDGEGSFQDAGGSVPNSLWIGAGAGSVGSVQVDGGTLDEVAAAVGGTGAAAGGAGLLALNGAPAGFEGETYTPATVQIDQLTIWSGGTLSLSGGSSLLVGELNVAGGAVGLDGGNFTVNAEFSQASDPDPVPGITVGAGGSIVGTGTLEVLPTTNAADNYGPAVPIQNAGLIEAAGGTITLGSTNNSGQLVAAAGAAIVTPAVDPGATQVMVTNSGTIAAEGGSITFGSTEDDPDGEVDYHPTALTNTGTIAAIGGSISIAGSVSGTGGILKLQGGTIGLGAPFNDSVDANGNEVRVISSYGTVVAGQSIVFSGTGNTLNVMGQFTNGSALRSEVTTADTLGTVKGFAPGDAIVFANADYPTAMTYAEGVLTLEFQAQNGFGQVNLGVGTGYTQSDFSMTENASGALVLTTSAGAVPAAEDFNGDGDSDLLLQNANGQIVIETQANLAVTGGAYLGNPGPTWHVVGSADFNGDGQPDLLLQNDNGSIVDYLMNGTAVGAAYNLANPGSSWHVRGTGDFNGDGKADIVLQNDIGQIVIYNTNGAAVTGAAYIGNPGAAWTVVGVADFNGDGNADLLLESSSGQLVDYLMSGDAIASGNSLGAPGAGWAVAGTGDFNGDGKADILLHNDNGADVIWNTNGVAVTGASYFGNPGASYTGAVTGVDLNGDGAQDLLLQGTDGSVVGFTLNGAGQPTAGALVTSPGAAWTAIGNEPMQFIDATGSAAGATVAATAGADEINFTSFLAGPHYVSGFDPAQDKVALSASTFSNYAAVQANEVAYQGGTFIALTPGSGGAALIVQGVTPGQLSAANFVLR